MSSDDIYGMREPRGSRRRKCPAVSQRRDEYLRAIGEEPVHHRRRHRHHQSPGLKAAVLYAFLGLSVLALMAAGAFWWLMHGR